MIKNMDTLFSHAYDFNGDLSNWDVSSATSMKGMFLHSQSFEGDGLETWNTGNVENMAYAFHQAYSFNRDLSNWDVSSATSMEGMFSYSQSFEGDGLETWNTGNVKNMQDMFWEAKKFNGKISNWDTTSATTMKWMFDKAKKFDQDVSGWTYHDGNMICDWVLEDCHDGNRISGGICEWVDVEQDSVWIYTCYGGQGAVTELMFLDAEAFL